MDFIIKLKCDIKECKYQDGDQCLIENIPENIKMADICLRDKEK